MQNPRSVSEPMIVTLCIIIGDSILRLASLGKLPMSFMEWFAVLGKPELLNGVIVGVLLLLAHQNAYRSDVGTSLILAMATTLAHRWMVGPLFRPAGMLVTAVMFFVLSWVSLWIASTVATRARE